MSTGTIIVRDHESLRTVAFGLHEQRNWSDAIHAWRELRINYPDDQDGFLHAIVALCEAGCALDAERLADDAIHAFGHTEKVLLERAVICIYTQDWPEGRRRYQELRQRFPLARVGYSRGVEVAEQLRDFQEALSITEAAVSAFPEDQALLLGYAVMADHVGDPRHAAAAWGAHRELYAEEKSFLGEARALAGCGNLHGADAALRAGREAFPGSILLEAETARMASRRADWAAALFHWTPLLAIPDLTDEAASRIRDAQRFMAEPREPALAHHGSTENLGIQTEALLRRTWRLRVEDNNGTILGNSVVLSADGALLNHYGDARSWRVEKGALCLCDEHLHTMIRMSDFGIRADGRMFLAGRHAYRPENHSSFLLEEQRPSVQAVMQAFESLGDNCEFGLVQRFYQFEPLGLLRFTGTYLDALIVGIRERFSALDSLDCVRIESVNGELVAIVDAYRFRYHTFRRGLDVDLVKFARSEAARLRFLADRLIEGVEDGNRIFVRKGPNDSLDRIIELHDAMRAQGGAKLLWVTEALDGHLPGTVERLRDGLLRGYIEEFAPYHLADHARYDTWEQICTRAHQMLEPAAWGLAGTKEP